MLDLSGNTQGLSASSKRLLERVSRRRVAPEQIVSAEMAGFMCECARDLGRQVGVTLDRRGNVVHVIVGDTHKLMLPDLGPRRAGIGRLRGLRLVHTHLRGEPLSHDDLMDLAKLRLDLVAAIQMRPDGQPGPISAAHLLPANPEGEQWRLLPALTAHELGRGAHADCLGLITSVEEEMQRKAAEARVVDDGRDRAVIVYVEVGRPTEGESESRIAELRELCRTAGLRVLDVVTQRRQAIDPRFLVGKGKLEELVLRALQVDATTLVFDRDLVPAQARTVSDATELKVIDRTMLILDIFAQHAHSRDGKLQTELAQLKYTLPRLHEKNTMMSRLSGGIGGRGPGETKLEINRRRARDKINALDKEIATLGRRRGERRALRNKSGLPVMSIVGYTNAGKSTLINTLTQGDVLVANKLFATLDPTSRRLRFPSEREIIVTDTVGFIRDLPRDLVAAFRATLEELDEADLLLHVVDAKDPAHPAHIEAVERILGELNLGDKPRLLVFNKMDRLTPEELQHLVAECAERAHQGGLADAPQLIAATDAETARPLLHAMERVLWREGVGAKPAPLDADAIA